MAMGRQVDAKQEIRFGEKYCSIIIVSEKVIIFHTNQVPKRMHIAGFNNFSIFVQRVVMENVNYVRFCNFILKI